MAQMDLWDMAVSSMEKGVTWIRDGSSAEEILDNVQGLDQVQDWTQGCNKDKIYLGVKAQNIQYLQLEKQISSWGKWL